MFESLDHGPFTTCHSSGHRGTGVEKRRRLLFVRSDILMTTINQKMFDCQANAKFGKIQPI